MKVIKRGEIVLANLEPIVGSEQGKIRPALIVQNDVGNEFSPVTIIAPVTSKVYGKEYPTDVRISSKESGLPLDSTVLLSHIRAVDKSRIIKKLGVLDRNVMWKVDLALKKSLDLF